MRLSNPCGPCHGSLPCFGSRGEDDLERAPGWPAVGMEWGREVIHPPVSCNCITRPTLSDISHKVLDPSWGREVCSRVPLTFHDLRLSKASLVLMWWMLSQGQIDLGSWMRTTSWWDWPFSWLSFFPSCYIAHLQHSFSSFCQLEEKTPPPQGAVMGSCQSLDSLCEVLSGGTLWAQMQPRLAWLAHPLWAALWQGPT